MQIELSPEALERVESLVGSGTCPSPEADAALDALETRVGYADSELAAFGASGMQSVNEAAFETGGR